MSKARIGIKAQVTKKLVTTILRIQLKLAMFDLTQNVEMPDPQIRSLSHYFWVMKSWWESTGFYESRKKWHRKDRLEIMCKDIICDTPADRVMTSWWESSGCYGQRKSGNKAKGKKEFGAAIWLLLGQEFLVREYWVLWSLQWPSDEMVLKGHVITVSLLLGDEILVTEEWVLQSKEETLASKQRGRGN